MRLLVIFLLISNSVFCHTNRRVSKTYGNIKLESSTYFYTEDINKNLIIGQYAEMLSKKISYSGEILIYLLQDQKTDFKIWGRSRDSVDDSSDLNIFISSPNKDISKCLQLIEKAITNRNKLFKHKDDFQSWYSSSNLTSDVVDVLKNKISRPNEVSELTIPKSFTSYFVNGNYHIIAIGENCESKEIGVYTDIYQICEVKNSILCIFTKIDEIAIYQAGCKYNFDEKKYIMNSNATTLKLDTLGKDYPYFRPYRIRDLGKENITFESFLGENVLLYSLSKKVFIQNLNEVIKN